MHGRLLIICRSVDTNSVPRDLPSLKISALTIMLSTDHLIFALSFKTLITVDGQVYMIAVGAKDFREVVSRKTVGAHGFGWFED